MKFFDHDSIQAESDHKPVSFPFSINTTVMKNTKEIAKKYNNYYRHVFDKISIDSFKHDKFLHTFHITCAQNNLT